MSTYSFIACRAEGTIEVHALDTEHGTLRRLSVVGGVEGVNTLAFDHERAILYAGRATQTPLLSVFTVVAGGRLEHRGDYELPHSLAFLAFDTDALLVASYHDSALSRIPVNADGLPCTEQPTFTDWDAGKNIHAVAATRDGAHVYATALGSDAIVGYRRGSGEEPALVRLPATAVEPAGAGPRHLVISSDGSRVTVVTEMTGEVITFARDAASGALTRVGQVSIVAPDDDLVTGVARVPGGAAVPERPIWAAELRQARSGALWLTTERTTSTLTIVRAGDAPRVLASTSTEERPRAAAVAPSGDLVLVGGETSGGVSVYRVSEAGEPELTQRIETGGNPAWFAFQRVD
ncbi:MAG: lactonase family protein [Arthrobacter sp.]|jgi:6-phosphogluconolactonase|nr:lactonase family protein [Arthrobacter sp.]